MVLPRLLHRRGRGCFTRKPCECGREASSVMEQARELQLLIDQAGLPLSLRGDSATVIQLTVTQFRKERTVVVAARKTSKMTAVLHGHSDSTPNFGVQTHAHHLHWRFSNPFKSILALFGADIPPPFPPTVAVPPAPNIFQ